MNTVVLIVVICTVVGVTQNSPINARARTSLGGIPADFPSSPPQPDPIPPQEPLPPIWVPPMPLPPIGSILPAAPPPVKLSGPSSSPDAIIHIQTKDFTHHQEAIDLQDDGTAVKGEYSFRANGITCTVVYVADKNGYRAKVSYRS